MLKKQLKKICKELFDKKLFKFIGVGALNTVLSAAVMLILYDIGGMGYWGSSVFSYVLGSILSFFMNKNFTFKSSSSLGKAIVKFSLCVAACYLIAYGLAKPFVRSVLVGSSIVSSQKGIDFAAMAFGMVLFTGLNYIGQRYFAFKG